MNDSFYRFIRPIVSFLFKLVFRPTINEKDNIPSNGKIVLAGNHTKFWDPVLILSSTKRTVHFLAKTELVDGKFGFIFKRMGLVPVNRKVHDKSVIPASLKFLNDGEIIGIFPEGTINRTSDVTMRFKTGAVRIANESESRIVPFAITGKYKPFRKSICITFGEAYSVSDDIEKENIILRDKVNTMIMEDK